ncbi:MAG: DUF2807 domain-containing protein [Acidimicrobiia bacterium]|nr:DUF2807 domain-containing protein [Acidimicrobiia bacterium]
MKRSPKWPLIDAAGLATVITAMHWRIRDLSTKSRDVSNFDEIVLLGSGNVHVDLAGFESLVIEADDNLLPILTSEGINGRRELGSSAPYASRSPITYTITAANLTRVEISGSGTVAVSTLSGHDFTADISGSGTIEPSGSCNALDVNISGSGGFRGANLLCTSGIVSVSGSGEALANVSDDLSVNISGSGNVEYVGDPSLTLNISGSGSVAHR